MPSNNRNRRTSTRNLRASTASTGTHDTGQPKGYTAATTRRNLRTKVRIRKPTRGSAVKGAQNRLRNFRQASILAVAITGFILLMFAPSEAGLAQDNGPDTVTVVEEVSQGESALADTATEAVAQNGSTKESAVEAIGALQGLWDSFIFNLPKILVALVTLVLAWLVVRVLRAILQRSIGRWQSSSAVISLVSIAVWLLAVGVALSVVAGDIRALVGSFGLIGLALSWSLQTPIESFTGWLMNSYQGYYRVGDRIRVGEVFGDVYRIDFLTTTVWEIGAPYQPGFVRAEQPTGRLVTFPNNEVLTGTIINLTGDFPYVWDELDVGVANESDVPLAMEVLEGVALGLLGNYMKAPAASYSQLLQRAGLDDAVPDKPQVFVSMDESWTNVTIRYLVGARERRKWKSELTLRITNELNKPEYIGKIIPVYPRQQIQFINPEGVPVQPGIADTDKSKS
ncbi:mechanosensitive ion channel [Pontibacter sp. JH31]|uniref:Mechanosensitive ion channel n=1 Tax=Pontibacter aquaedesilientis TaxID=2766980 RepID=A0ABR7XIL0_9BACT|nr:mechanosensitive ion channel domain-containing protein [Pontibacter aquaedesilientis]MBD1398094.1 mechanosensitive ion channel [Pontibacter aquaedesilientis]